MRTLRYLLPLLALQAAVVGSATAVGNPASPSIMHWRCWYDGRVEIVCLLDKLSDFQLKEEPSSRLPPIVQELRRNPEQFQNTPLHIPLFSPPIQADFPAQLARSAVCGSRLDCTVDFTMRPPSPREISDLLGPDASPETLLDPLRTSPPN
ncbi:MAG TPA: hypothetical protein VFF03_15425 [Rhodocyclaceae bacterium]|nr:hypothetical protein [Rhodocyclaceae bacterium]